LPVLLINSVRFVSSSFTASVEKVMEYARKAAGQGEVPVAAAVLEDDEIISIAHNSIVTDPAGTSHAEILALQQAFRHYQSERLVNCDLLVTLEPCVMCTGALVLSRVNRIFYLVNEKKAPAARKILNMPGFNHYPRLIHLPMYEKEAARLLSEFFKRQREMGAR
jgi:tRNA(adenine34) deaminase